ncbi:MAG TPA: tandem-95 repeat protein, partial [Candidatus Sulfotelmatobacter sp.]|nr:tandem-95 repeat protein [Candidatus Sulfotelmatobacter sp.]
SNRPPVISTFADQIINENSSVGPIAFTIGDFETPADALILSVSSSNPVLTRESDIVLGGSGSNRTIRIVSANNQSGDAIITVRITDQTGATASSSFNLTVEAINSLPVMSGLSDLAMDEDAPTGSIPFIVRDLETPSSNLLVSAISDNPVLVPGMNIVLAGNGEIRTIAINPAPNLFGRAVITVTVSDAAGGSASQSFVLTVNGVNDAPSISGIEAQSTDKNRSSGRIEFVVGDVETAASNLVVSASSSNPALVPEANIILGGSGSNRTVQISPAANQAGQAIIRLSVRDAEGATSQSSFALTVRAVNDLPVLSAVADQETVENGATPELGLVVGDTESAAGVLLLSARSSNPSLLPEQNIVFGGSGSNRTVRLVPATNQWGTAVVTLMVSDEAGGSTSRSFSLQVQPVNQLPEIGPLRDLVLEEDSPSGAIPLVVRDGESPAAELVLSAHCSDPALVPDNQMVLGGSGVNRVLSFVPATNRFGSAVVTVTVRDGEGASASASFTLRVNPVNDRPELSAIADQELVENT